MLIGECTKYLYRLVRWELDLALELELPIIAVNLNGQRQYYRYRCPPILRGEYVVHVSFKRGIIKHALDYFPKQHAQRCIDNCGPLRYSEDVYQQLGILPKPSTYAQLRPVLPSPTAPPLLPPLGAPQSTITVADLMRGLNSRPPAPLPPPLSPLIAPPLFQPPARKPT